VAEIAKLVEQAASPPRELTEKPATAS
jgi:hypothetical protein